MAEIKPLIVPGRCPNKANSNMVMVGKEFAQTIKRQIVYAKEMGWRRWWIAPTSVVKAYENEVAMRFKTYAKTYEKDARLVVYVSLVNQRIDVDGALKAILDGIELSGRISNDRQFWVVICQRVNRKGQKASVEIAVQELGDSTQAVAFVLGSLAHKPDSGPWIQWGPGLDETMMERAESNTGTAIGPDR